MAGVSIRPPDSPLLKPADHDEDTSPMDTQRIATTHQISHHADEIELTTPVGPARSARNMDRFHQEIYDLSLIHI